jgi:hypothetical protein
VLLSCGGAPLAALAAGALGGRRGGVMNWWLGAMLGGGLVGALLGLAAVAETLRRGWITDSAGSVCGGALIIGAGLGAVLGLGAASVSDASTGAAAGAALALLGTLWLALDHSANQAGRASAACRTARGVIPGGTLGLAFVFGVALAARLLTGTTAVAVTAAIGGLAGGLVSFLLVRRRSLSLLAGLAAASGPMSPGEADRRLVEG